METREPIERLREELEVCGCDPNKCMMCSVPSKVRAALDEIEAAYMRLPMDADGVPIRPEDDVVHIGDPPRHSRVVVAVSEESFYCSNNVLHPSRMFRRVKPVTCGDNLVHVSREDWDDLSDAMDKLRAERGRLAEGLRCMNVERDFWRDEVKRMRELVDSLSMKLGDDEGMA